MCDLLLVCRTLRRLSAALRVGQNARYRVSRHFIGFHVGPRHCAALMVAYPYSVLDHGRQQYVHSRIVHCSSPFSHRYIGSPIDNRNRNDRDCLPVFGGEHYAVQKHSKEGGVVQVRMVKMFKRGVEVERRMLLDRSTRQYRGELVIMDATDQGRHRPVKVARLMSEPGTECELLEVHVVWSNGDRITFRGD